MRGALEVRAGCLSLIASPRPRGSLHLRPLPRSGASPESVPAAAPPTCPSAFVLRMRLCVCLVFVTLVSLYRVCPLSPSLFVSFSCSRLPMSLYLSSPVHLRLRVLYFVSFIRICPFLSACDRVPSACQLCLYVLYMLIHLCVGATSLLPESRRAYRAQPGKTLEVWEEAGKEDEGQ